MAKPDPFFWIFKNDIFFLKPEIKLVLNGGKEELDSATIPIQWGFNKDAIKRAPQHLLFVVLSYDDIRKQGSYQNEYYGDRQACSVKDGFKFIQVHKPGKHLLLVMAIGNKIYSEDGQEWIKSNLAKTLSKEHYDLSITTNKNSLDYLLKKNRIVCYKIVEFIVPEELFAKKPETKVTKTIWNYVNMYHSNPPLNECDYRRRAILAFTLKIPVVLLHLTLLLLIRTAHSILVLALSFIIFFFGFRPKPILKESWKAFKGDKYPELEIIRRNWGISYKYRVWAYKDDFTKIYMPVTPIEIALPVGIIYLCIQHLEIFKGIGIVLAGIAVFFLIAITMGRASEPIKKLASSIFKPNPEKLKAKKLKKLAKYDRLAKKEHLRQEAKNKEIEKLKQAQLKWLDQNLHSDAIEEKVNLKKLPKPDSKLGSVAQTFRVSYWTLKAKICKPYSN